MKKLSLFLLSAILSLYTFAQLKVEIKKESQWYASPIAWVIGAAVFILLLVAILRGRKD
jgi:hypothetical protein